MRRNLVTFLHARFDPAFHAQIEPVERAGAGKEAARRIFGIEAGFDGVAFDRQLVLRPGDFFAARDAQLPFDQIDAGDLLGHRMFDLKPCIHFHEEDAVGAQAFAGIGDEFHRPGAFVIHRLGGAHGGGAQFFAGFRIHARGGGFLDHLLVAALERAVAFEQVDDIAVGIAENLHFDMARRGDPFFEQHLVVREAGLGLALAALQHLLELRRLVDLAHPLAAAARDRLDQHGIADRVGLFLQSLGALVFAVISRRHRHARFAHQLLGGILQAHRLDA